MTQVGNPSDKGSNGPSETGTATVTEASKKATPSSRPKRKCYYGGHEVTQMDFPNFTREEIRDYERRRGVTNEPEQCHGCAAMRKLQWVKRSLGGPGSGCWQWSLIFPYHNVVRKKEL